MKVETIIGPVSIVELDERAYVGIRLETPFPGMFAKVTSALKELRAWVKTNKLPETGPYFVRYYRCNMKEMMDVEVGILGITGTVADGRVRPGVLPSGRYASLTYRGNGLRGNQALMKWAVETNSRFDPLDPQEIETYVCRYEAYLTDYRVESRKLLWDVELSIRLADESLQVS